MRRFVLFIMFSTCLSAISGCGDGVSDKPELGTVHGIVTLDGQPLSGVGVLFKPELGRQSIATTNEVGEYNAMYLVDEEGVKIGPCVVYVQWSEETPGPRIPAKYGSMSELKLDVKAGDNVYNIEITSK